MCLQRTTGPGSPSVDGRLNSEQRAAQGCRPRLCRRSVPARGLSPTRQTSKRRRPRDHHVPAAGCPRGLARGAEGGGRRGSDRCDRGTACGGHSGEGEGVGQRERPRVGPLIFLSEKDPSKAAKVTATMASGEGSRRTAGALRPGWLPRDSYVEPGARESRLRCSDDPHVLRRKGTESERGRGARLHEPDCSGRSRGGAWGRGAARGGRPTVGWPATATATMRVQDAGQAVRAPCWSCTEIRRPQLVPFPRRRTGV